MYAVPKGGDLHNHLGGAGFDDILFELATDDSVNCHQTFRTRVRINECSVDCGAPLAYFHTVSDATTSIHPRSSASVGAISYVWWWQALLSADQVYAT